jgi:hypothetical protein
MTDPRIEALIPRWLDEFARLVRARDPGSARHLFAPTCTAFGTRVEHADDLDELASRQWGPTWDATREFRFVAGTVGIVSAGSGAACATARWESQGIAADGSTFDRRGRASIVLAEDETADLGLRAVHTHFSESPRGTA